MRTLAYAVHMTMSGSLSGSMNGRSFVSQPSMHPTRSVPSSTRCPLSCLSAEAAGTIWRAAWRKSCVEHAACRILQTLLLSVLSKVTCSLAQYAMQLPVLLRNLQPVFTAGLYPVGAAGRHIKRHYLRVIFHILPYKFQCHAIVWTDFPSSLSSPSLCSNVPSNRSHGHGVWVAASVWAVLWCRSCGVLVHA